MKRTIPVIFVFVMILNYFSGCGQKTDLDETRQTVYSSTQTDISEFNATQMRFTSGGIVLFNGANIINLDFNGIVKSEIELQNHLNENEYYITFDIDGDYWALKTDENLADLSVDKFDSGSNVIESIDIESGFFGIETNSIPQRLLVSDDYFYIQTLQTVYVFDKNGKFVMQTPENNANNTDEYMKSMFRLKDGKPAAFSVGLDNNSWVATIRIIEPILNETQDFIIPLAGSGGDSFFTKGDQLDLLMCVTTGIYDYSLSDEDRIGIFNFLDYGINIANLADLTLLTDGGILLAMRDEPFGIIKEIIRYTPLEDGEFVNRKTITLAAFDVDYWLQGYITDFNKNNSEYKIEVRSYKDSNEEDALKRFNLDLMAGNIPDIVVLNRTMPSNSYINKGLFTDIYPLMNKDANFNKDDYLANAFSSLERDGKLYEIFPMYMIDTIAAKESEVGADMGWSLDEFADYISQSNSRYIIDSFSKVDFIRIMVQFLFIDPITGECNFDVETFNKILEISQRFPDKGLNENEDYAQFLRGLADGDPMMYNSRPMRFRSIRIDEILYFSEPVTFKGFPGTTGNGSYFMPCARFAISEKSDNKDGAWEFIKYMLEEYNDIYELYMPVKLSELERLSKEAMETPYYIDGNGKKIEMEYTVYGGELSGEVFIGNNTKEQSDKMMDLIRSIKYVRQWNETVTNIIIEEVESYLAYSKPAEDLAAVIENRVNIYVSELS